MMEKITIETTNFLLRSNGIRNIGRKVEWKNFIVIFVSATVTTTATSIFFLSAANGTDGATNTFTDKWMLSNVSGQPDQNIVDDNNATKRQFVFLCQKQLAFFSFYWKRNLLTMLHHIRHLPLLGTHFFFSRLNSILNQQMRKYLSSAHMNRQFRHLFVCVRNNKREVRCGNTYCSFSICVCQSYAGNTQTTIHGKEEWSTNWFFSRARQRPTDKLKMKTIYANSRAWTRSHAHAKLYLECEMNFFFSTISGVSCWKRCPIFQIYFVFPKNICGFYGSLFVDYTNFEYQVYIGRSHVADMACK